MNRNRNRLVSFRLSPEELEHLRVACLLQGARNLSDFARGAVLELTGPRAQQHAHMLDRFSTMELRLTEMQSALQQTHETVRALVRALANRDQEKVQARGM